MRRALAAGLALAAAVALAGCDVDGTKTYERDCGRENGQVTRLPDTTQVQTTQVYNGKTFQTQVSVVTHEHFECTVAGRVVSHHDT